MTVKLVSLSHRHYEPVLKMIGRSGKTYIFRWDSKIGYYSYETEEQTAVSDLMEGCMHWQHGFLNVLLPPKPPKPQKTQVKKAPAKKKPAAV